jgi:hypothetical protein
MITPILHLKMEGNAKDSSGNNNDGTVVGATLTEDRFGRPNSAYEFDGGNDYITHGYNFGFDTTVSFWINSVDASQYRRVIASGSSNDYPFTIGTYETKLMITHYDEVKSLKGFSIADGVWHNVTVVMPDGDRTNTSVYIDGHYTELSEFASIYSISDYNAIGAKSDGNNSITGKIDDVRTYTQALTPTQVKFLYDNTRRKHGRN